MLFFEAICWRVGEKEIFGEVFFFFFGTTTMKYEYLILYLFKPVSVASSK